MWRVDLRQPSAWVDEAAAKLLTAGEREHGARGKPAVRRRRVVARAALRIALSRSLACAPESLEFDRTAGGKPTLTSGRGLHFNVSSSGDCCVIALTRLGAVGVDVECVVTLPECREIARSRFAPAEASAIHELEGERRLQAFFHCWTRKEAYLKATGAGMTAGLDGVVVTADEMRPAILSLRDGDPGGWSIAALCLRPDLVGAVVVSGAHEWSGGTVSVEELDLAHG